MKTDSDSATASKRVRYRKASLILGIPLPTLYALVHQKRVPHYRYGPRFVVFDVDELEAWVAERRVAATTHREAQPNG